MIEPGLRDKDPGPAGSWGNVPLLKAIYKDRVTALERGQEEEWAEVPAGLPGELPDGEKAEDMALVSMEIMVRAKRTQLLIIQTDNEDEKICGTNKRWYARRPFWSLQTICHGASRR